MSSPGMPTRSIADPTVAIGRLAALLASGAGLPAALEALIDTLGIRTAVVRSGSGELLGAAGELLHAVPASRGRMASEASVELPIPGRADVAVGHLTVLGARPSQLPVLRAAAAVVGLALAAAPSTEVQLLLDQTESGYDSVADDLHDGLGQLLVAARWAADAAIRGGSPIAARDAVQEALVSLRRTLWHLRPRGRTGLGPALDALSGQLSAAGDEPLTIRGAAGPGGVAGGTAAVMAYRLVQAVARPGSPGAQVDMRIQDGSLVVLVEGGAPLADPHRWTLRARVLGGDLWSRGGRIRLDLPNPEPRNAL